jgi:hypothetical protein
MVFFFSTLESRSPNKLHGIGPIECPTSLVLSLLL